MEFNCAYCRRLGVDCEGANLISLNAVELLEFCRSRKNHLGWSNQRLAEESGVPKGTIDGLFSGERIDFKYETIRPIIKAFTGVDLVESYCPEHEEKAVEAKIEHQEETIKRLESDKYSLQASRQTLLEYLNDKTSENQNRFEFMKHQVEVRNRTIIFLISLLILFMGVIGYLVYDDMRPQPTHFGQDVAEHYTGAGTYKLQLEGV